MDALVRWQENIRHIRFFLDFPDTRWFNLAGPIVTFLSGATPDLTTWKTRELFENSIDKLKASRVAFITTASNMDLNGNLKIDKCSNESTSIRDFFLIPRFLQPVACILDIAVNFVFQNTARVATVRVMKSPCLFGRCIVAIAAVPPAFYPFFQGNDVFVTLKSARGPEEYKAISVQIPNYVLSEGRTHANIADKDAAEDILPYFKSQEALRGDMMPFR